MKKEIKNQFMQMFFRFRRNGLDYIKIADLNMTELFVMNSLSENLFNDGTRVDLAEIQNHTYVTKAAISKMFTSLEKKGYVIRETDRANRRKITVELTACGKKVVEDATEKADEVLDLVISRFGEEKVCQLISLMDQLSDITEALKSEWEQPIAVD